MSAMCHRFTMVVLLCWACVGALAFDYSMEEEMRDMPSQLKQDYGSVCESVHNDLVGLFSAQEHPDMARPFRILSKAMQQEGWDAEAMGELLMAEYPDKNSSEGFNWTLYREDMTKFCKLMLKLKDKSWQTFEAARSRSGAAPCATIEELQCKAPATIGSFATRCVAIGEWESCETC